MKYIMLLFLSFLIFFHAHSQDDYLLKSSDLKSVPSCLSFSPDGSLLLAGFSNGSFSVLDPETQESTLDVPNAHLKAVTALDMPPKMDFIMSAGGKMIKVWGRDGRHVGNFSGHATTIWNADISNDGKHAVSAAFNKTFLLWDVYNGVVEAKMRGHEDITLAVAISPYDKLIASGSRDLSIKLWDLESKTILRSLNGPTEDVYDLAFSPDGKVLAAASGEKVIRLYDVESGELLNILKGHRGPVRRLSFSSDGKFLASASEDQSSVLWDVRSGKKIYVFFEGEGAVHDVAWHPDGKSIYLITASSRLKRMEVHPEIFVLAYYSSAYLAELETDPLFASRQKGESKKDYLARQEEAGKKKAKIIDSYYQRYLKEFDK